MREWKSLYSRSLVTRAREALETSAQSKWLCTSRSLRGVERQIWVAWAAFLAHRRPASRADIGKWGRRVICHPLRDYVMPTEFHIRTGKCDLPPKGCKAYGHAEQRPRERERAGYSGLLCHSWKDPWMGIAAPYGCILRHAGPSPSTFTTVLLRNGRLSAADPLRRLTE